MKNILIVEDERSLNEAYQMILKKNDYSVHSAFDGNEAIQITEKMEPDLILLDLRMPNMGGLEFLNEYDLPNKHPGVKVVVFSNMDTQDDIDKAFEMGAEKYVLKAWASPKELLLIVNQMLDNKQSVAA